MGKSFRRNRDDWDDDYHNKSNKFKNRRQEKKKKNKMKSVPEPYDPLSDDSVSHHYDMEYEE